MSHGGLKRVVHGLERITGRTRLAKFARLLTNEVRLDDPSNDLRVNGEGHVQRVALTDRHPVVFDVGAHYGEWSESLLKQPGNPPELYAFEPSATSYSVARETIGSRANLRKLALSDKAGSARLHIVHEGAGSNSLVPFTDSSRPSGVHEDVLVSTVDLFASEMGVERITLLKVDAEGHDLDVLNGSTEMLSRGAIGLVQFEYNLRWIDSRHFLLDAFELLQPLGYEVGKITARGVEAYSTWHHELETFREANFIAFQPEWRKAFKTIDWWGG